MCLEDLSRNATDQNKVLSPYCVIRVILSVPTGARDNTAGHVMDMGCRGGLSSREQDQRPSARSGIAVLTIIMRTAMQPQKSIGVTLLYNCRNNTTDPIHKDLEFRWQLKKDHHFTLKLYLFVQNPVSHRVSCP